MDDSCRLTVRFVPPIGVGVYRIHACYCSNLCCLGILNFVTPTALQLVEQVNSAICAFPARDTFRPRLVQSDSFIRVFADV